MCSVTRTSFRIPASFSKYTDRDYKMKLFFHHTETNKRLEIDVHHGQTVRDVKLILEDHFKLDTSSSETEEKRIVLEYFGSDLNDNWILNDLTINPGSTIKCMVKEEKISEFHVFVKFQKERLKLFDTGMDPEESYILEFRIYLSKLLGLPLSIFRLKDMTNNVDLFDEKKLGDYKINRKSDLVLETWVGWDSFLLNCIKGFTKQAIKLMSQDEFIRQYQMKVALYLAAHYGNLDLTKTLLFMGVRADRPVGEHPCRQWCQSNWESKGVDASNKYEYLKLEYLKCPVHVAVLNGQLKILNFISKMCIHVLEQKDGYDLPPWRLALHNKHKDPVKSLDQKDVARFLLGKQFGGKVKLSDDCNISIHLYAKIKTWADRAKEKVIATYGISKSSIKKRPLNKGGLLGNKVLIDGFNNNFKEQLNSYDRLRAKYKYYYFYDDEDKDKHGYPDLYFKTVGLIKPSQTKATDNQSKKEKIQRAQNDRPTPKTLPLWKKAVNTIIFRKTIRKYYDILVSLDVEVDLDDLDLGDEEDEFMVEKTSGLKREKSMNFKSGSVNTPNKVANLGRSKSLKSFTVSKNKLGKESSNLFSINKKRPDKPQDKQPNKLLPKLNNKNSVYNASVTYFGEKLETIRKTNRLQNGIFTFKQDLKYETMKTYEKYCDGVSSYENAKAIFEDAKTFKAKSWIQQINLASRMAEANAKRRIQKNFQINDSPVQREIPGN